MGTSIDGADVIDGLVRALTAESEARLDGIGLFTLRGDDARISFAADARLCERLAAPTRTATKDPPASSFSDALVAALARDGKATVAGLGQFTLHLVKGYTGTNPRTGEKIEVPGKAELYFKADPIFASRVSTGGSKAGR